VVVADHRGLVRSRDVDHLESLVAMGEVREGAGDGDRLGTGRVRVATHPSRCRWVRHVDDDQAGIIGHTAKVRESVSTTTRSAP
jgi:hypothetical protein